MSYHSPIEPVHEAYKPRGTHSLAGMQGAPVLWPEQVNKLLRRDRLRYGARPVEEATWMVAPREASDLDAPDHFLVSGDSPISKGTAIHDAMESAVEASRLAAEKIVDDSDAETLAIAMAATHLLATEPLGVSATPEQSSMLGTASMGSAATTPMSVQQS